MAYFFKRYFEPQDVDKVVRVIADRSETELEAFRAVYAKFIKHGLVSDENELVSIDDPTSNPHVRCADIGLEQPLLFAHRKATLHSKRSEQLMQRIADNAVSWNLTFNPQQLRAVLTLWNRSVGCTTVAQLDSFLIANPDHKTIPGHAVLPWPDFRRVLGSLPCTLP